METRIQKWGNSLAVRIPKHLAENLHLARGSTVELHIQDGNLVLVPYPAAVTLDDLLGDVTPNNLHGETVTGEPQGRESW